MTSSAALLLVLGISLSSSVGAQSPTGTTMYIKMLEAMVRRLGGSLPTRPAEASPAASASPGVQCGAPPSVARASTSFTSRQAGAQARFSCDIGYGPGEATTMCQPNGQWSPVSLVCNPVDCGLPTTVVGGVATYESTTYGSSVTYRCKPGFSNIGGTTVGVCQESGMWSKPTLTCAPTTPEPSPGAPNVDKLRSLLTTFQNSPLAARLPPEMRAMLSKSQQVLNSYSVTMPPPTRPSPIVPSAASQTQGNLPPHMMAMLHSMKASMPPAMKAMLNNAVPSGTVSPSLTPASSQPKRSRPDPPKNMSPMQNMQNMMNTMQQMQMMRMLMSQKPGGGASGKGGQGNAAMDPEAIAEAAADSMQRNLMLGMATGMMPNAMANPLAALMGGNNPLAALRNAYNQNLKNDPFAFPATSPGSPGSRTDPFLFEVPRTPGSGQQSQGQNNNNNGMNPMLMAALLGNGLMGMFGGSA